MARSLTPRDCHAIINSMYREITGQSPEIAAVDTSTFVSVGEKLLSYSTENILNSLSIVIGRTFMAVRPYTSKFGIIEETDTALYKNRVRKISYYSRYALASGDWNTQLYTNFADGFTNGQNLDSNRDPQSTKSMFEQYAPMPFELSFAGSSTWQDSVPIYRDQLKVAFENEAVFGSFVAGILTEKGNDIELQKEAFRRLTLLNHMAGAYALAEDYPTMAFNLTAGYNAKFGTNYTSEELRTSQLKSFLEYLVATIKTLSRRMEYRTAAFHMPYTKTVDDIEYNVLRHTPRDRQKLFLYSPLMIDAEAQVMPEIFNDEYLKISNYEAVDYWQNFNEPAKISIKAAIPGSDGTQTATDEAITIPYVVGCLFDTDAILVNNYLEDSLTSPVEARKRYNVIWWTFCRNAVNDFSENFILLYMDDSGVTPTPGTGMTVTPDTVTITVDELGAGSANVTITNIPEGATSVALLATYDGDWSLVPVSGDVYTVDVTNSAGESYTDHNVIIASDGDGNILTSVNITINIVAPEG